MVLLLMTLIRRKSCKVFLFSLLHRTKAEISSLLMIILFRVHRLDLLLIILVYFVDYIVDTLFVAFSNTFGRVLPEIASAATLEHMAIIEHSLNNLAWGSLYV